nr:hypothetical protein [Legionella jordanis]
MNNCSIKKLRLLPTCVASFILVLAMSFSASTQAAAPISTTANPTQLAYYYVVGSPGYYGYGHRPYYYGYRPYYYGTYWSGWRPYYWRAGSRCQKSCLINRHNGRVIRCRTRCF